MDPSPPSHLVPSNHQQTIITIIYISINQQQQVTTTIIPDPSARAHILLLANHYCYYWTVQPKLLIPEIPSLGAHNSTSNYHYPLRWSWWLSNKQPPNWHITVDKSTTVLPMNNATVFNHLVILGCVSVVSRPFSSEGTQRVQQVGASIVQLGRANYQGQFFGMNTNLVLMEGSL